MSLVAAGIADDLIGLMPPIRPFDPSAVPAAAAFIGAVGFEDRATSALQKLTSAGVPLGRLLCVRYKPYDRRNRLRLWRDSVDCMGHPRPVVQWVAYDRSRPAAFEDTASRIALDLKGCPAIYVDVSAMSRLLMLTVLQALRALSVPVNVLYSEALVYHPTQEEFDRKVRSLPAESPTFLTRGVFNIACVPALSGTSMQGAPLAVVAFPSFSPQLLSALINEITPESLILVEGEPHLPENAWRRQAIREVNRAEWLRAEHRGSSDSMHLVVSTFDYRETVSLLEEIYHRYYLSHRLVVAPSGSKLQTLGVFVSKQLHPDIDIVYPTPRSFFKLYTEGCLKTWEIRFGRFARFVGEADKHRRRALGELDFMLNAASTCKSPCPDS